MTVHRTPKAGWQEGSRVESMLVFSLWTIKLLALGLFT